MWQLLWLNMTLRQHGLSDLHLDFCVLLMNILEENLNLKVQHKKIMIEKWYNLKTTQKHDSKVDL